MGTYRPRARARVPMGASIMSCFTFAVAIHTDVRALASASVTCVVVRAVEEQRNGRSTDAAHGTLMGASLHATSTASRKPWGRSETREPVTPRPERGAERGPTFADGAGTRRTGPGPSELAPDRREPAADRRAERPFARGRYPSNPPNR